MKIWSPLTTRKSPKINSTPKYSICTSYTSVSLPFPAQSMGTTTLLMTTSSSVLCNASTKSASGSCCRRGTQHLQSATKLKAHAAHTQQMARTDRYTATRSSPMTGVTEVGHLIYAGTQPRVPCQWRRYAAPITKACASDSSTCLQCTDGQECVYNLHIRLRQRQPQPCSAP